MGWDASLYFEWTTLDKKRLDAAYARIAPRFGRVAVSALPPYLPSDPTEAGFLARLRNFPGEVATRVVYADWLEQRGDHARATVLRYYAGEPVHDHAGYEDLLESVDQAWQTAVDPDTCEGDDPQDEDDGDGELGEITYGFDGFEMTFYADDAGCRLRVESQHIARGMVDAASDCMSDFAAELGGEIDEDEWLRRSAERPGPRDEDERVGAGDEEEEEEEEEEEGEEDASVSTEVCRVTQVSFGEGRGTIVDEAGRASTFDLDAFVSGGWRPTRAEARAEGGAVPRVGEVVAVAWKAAGEEDAREIIRVSRIVDMQPGRTLTEWIAGVRAHTGQLHGMTARQLRTETEALDEPASRGRSWNACNAWRILVACEELADPELAPWIGSIDRGDDDLVPGLAELLGVEEPETFEDLDDFLRQCNAAAKEEELAERLYEIHADEDRAVVVAVEPAQFERLEAEGYLMAPFAPAPMPRGASAFDQARAALSAASSETEEEDVAFDTFEELAAHLLVAEDDVTRTAPDKAGRCIGLWIEHADSEASLLVWPEEIGGEPWAELTVEVTDAEIDAGAALESASTMTSAVQLADGTLQLRMKMPVSALTAARLVALVDTMVEERTELRETLGIADEAEEEEEAEEKDGDEEEA